MLQRKNEKHGKRLGRTTDGFIDREACAGVEFVGGVNYDEVDESGNLHITVKKGKNKTPEKKVLDVDTIIVCAGQESLFDLEAPLKSRGVNVSVRARSARTQKLYPSNTTNITLSLTCTIGKYILNVHSNVARARTQVHRIGGAAYAGEVGCKAAIDMGTLGVRIEVKRRGYST